MQLEDYIQKAKESKQAEKQWLSQFIDDFRRLKDVNMLSQPISQTDVLSQTFVATAHQLVLDMKLQAPLWMNNVYCLSEPHFLSQLMHSRFLALRDSPYAFKIRNIFVPFNFLSRI